ncbi:replication protein [Peribacillus frigoritolerans]|uniref:replication protein n=1 Tax=Peribacillus frigoritolerans TaxID=450367 RepID=UPI0023D9F60A|nr:replication protein [Peribacillus frigoritolerans]MDF1997625.1 replication protein [Peribacillus frigoritolerans]
MANPQTENGYTRIANELLEQIMKLSLNGTQFRIVLAVWRYTYGFRRTAHTMPLSYIASKIEASKGQVQNALDQLIKKRIIEVVEDSKGGRKLKVNKNYDEWESKESPVPAASNPMPIKPKKVAKIKAYEEDNTYYKMAVYFHSLVKAVAKEAGIEHLIARANLQTWADDFRKLVELEKVEKRLAKEVMDWVITDDFWRTNILSASTFRKQFAKLALKMASQKKPSQHRKQTDSRDKDIEFQQWVAGGGDPNDFNWN